MKENVQIHLTGDNVEVTPAIRSYTEEKLGKLGRHFNKITGIHVILNIEKLMQIAEATVLIKGEELHARAESENMYNAIDALLDKLDRQLLRHKEKLKNHHHDDKN